MISKEAILHIALLLKIFFKNFVLHIAYCNMHIALCTMHYAICNMHINFNFNVHVANFQTYEKILEDRMTNSKSSEKVNKYGRQYRKIVTLRV
jgi:hypothetical protein